MAKHLSLAQWTPSVSVNRSEMACVLAIKKPEVGGGEGETPAANHSCSAHWLH